MIENTGAIPKRRNSSEQIRGKMAAQEESCKSLEIEGEKHGIKSEKKRKVLDRKIMKLKIKMVNEIIKSEEFTDLENNEAKRISAEFYFLTLLAGVLMCALEAKIEERHTAFNQKRKEGRKEVYLRKKPKMNYQLFLLKSNV